MKKLPEDFQPSERVYTYLAKHGAIREFVDHEMENFMAYWLDPNLPPSKAKKKSWDKTFLNWMRRAWKGKAGREWENERDRLRMYPNRSGSNGLKSFSEHQEPEPKKSPVRRKYKLPERESVDPMSFEEASQQLKRMGIVK